MRTACGKFFQPLILFWAIFEFAASATWHTSDDNQKYLIETECNYNWLQASDECAKRGLQLVVLENATKNQHFDTLLRRVLGKSYDLWIGYHDELNPKIVKDRPFYSAATGETMTFSNWASGEPNDSGSAEDCVQIRNTTDFKWNDKRCDVTFGFVCEEHHLTLKYRVDLDVKRQTTNQKNINISDKFSTIQTEMQEIILNTRSEADNILVELKQSADEMIADLKSSLQVLLKTKPYLQAVIADVGQTIDDAVLAKEEEFAIVSAEARQLMDNIHQSAEDSISQATSTFAEELVSNTKEIDTLLVY